MDCFNYSCPFRVNKSSNVYRCECIACPNRKDNYYTITWNTTLTKDEMDKIKRKFDPDYGCGKWC